MSAPRRPFKIGDRVRWTTREGVEHRGEVFQVIELREGAQDLRIRREDGRCGFVMSHRVELINDETTTSPVVRVGQEEAPRQPEPERGGGRDGVVTAEDEENDEYKEDEE